MNIGKEKAPVEVPLPVHPDQRPASPAPAAEPAPAEPREVPA